MGDHREGGRHTGDDTENKCTANYLAKLAINTQQKMIFQQFNQLEKQGIKILNMDKHHVPAVRIKTRKIYINNNGQHA
ncbi:hypothetical protein H5410_022276 [Solanum commersonii]|uniref:Uncharacterized protein n=1 Tax=Solanum commersonii TaxID=4109 RepID=A0A9J5ZDI1_SOLCO|nr:hypothetical protein H5410_022276 [Solanum commersonii]